MKVFDAYSKYYDLLYKDKDYNSEVDYIEKTIKLYKTNTRKILDLGCGTGRHDFLFAKRGYNVTGIELSEQMIDIAKENLRLNPQLQGCLNFFQGDARNIFINKKFDLVVALFHVMSYQNTNKDVMATLEVARKHLSEDGLFLFDFWYGPAVLTDRPNFRVKNFEDDEVNIQRFAEPELLINENIVDVNYKVMVKDKNGGSVNEIKETHCMRYFFIPEIKFMLESVNLDIIKFEEWMTGNELSEKTWYATVIARKKNN